jgi:hypothetical protein
MSMLNSKSPNSTEKTHKNTTNTTLFEKTGERTNTFANKATSTNQKFTTTERTNDSKNQTIRSDPAQSTLKNIK